MILNGRLPGLRLLMLIASGLLLLLGIATIYAAAPEAAYWKKQIFFAILGCGAIIAVNLIHYRDLGPMSYYIYGGTLLVLFVILLDKVIDLPFIPYINGSRRWVVIGFDKASIQVQPSEFCKIAHIIALGWYLRFRSNYRTFKGLIGPFALTILAMMLILLEPDLGTVLLMMPVLFAMLFVAGAKIKHLMAILMLGIIVSPFMWMHMHSYQRMRISGVLLQNQTIYRLAMEHESVAKVLAGSKVELSNWMRDKGYQLRHSKYAISSGGIKGYGFNHGPYIENSYLPERHNDLIFPMIAHQWGLIGALVMFGLYFVIIACGLEIALHNTDPYARLIAVGIITMFSVGIIQNVSMAIGLMPITGTTLPLISYGGSSLIVNMMAIGLLNNIGRSRPFTVAGKAFEFGSRPSK